MDFDDSMMKALELDRIKLESMGMTQPTADDVFHCLKCGCRGEEKFSWDGKCLICEEGDDDHLTQEEHPSRESGVKE